MPNPTARTRGRNCRAIRTPPDWGPDIFHPLLLTFDSSEESGQRYISPRSSLPARRRPTAVDAARFGNLTHPMESQEPNPAALIPANATSEDLVAALDDPDYLERMRHSPRPPADRRLKR